MAKKKQSSQAEQAVSDVKKNTGSSNSRPASRPKPAAKKTTASSKRKPATKAEKAAADASRIPVALLSFVLFAVFAILSLNPEGALLKLMKSIVLGFLGPAAFYFAIPGFFYIFFINTFGRRTAVRMRSVCTLLFVMLCGCIFHLTVQTQGMAAGIQIIPDLYLSGMEGISGGILCGGIALLLKWACGRWVSLLICALCAVLALLGAMEITPASIVRAIANRPRDEEDEEEQEYIEPAALVVNHIANRRIEKKRQHNARLEGVGQSDLPELEMLPESIQ